MAVTTSIYKHQKGGREGGRNRFGWESTPKRVSKGKREVKEKQAVGGGRRRRGRGEEGGEGGSGVVGW